MRDRDGARTLGWVLNAAVVVGITSGVLSAVLAPTAFSGGFDWLGRTSDLTSGTRTLPAIILLVAAFLLRSSPGPSRALARAVSVVAALMILGTVIDAYWIAVNPAGPEFLLRPAVNVLGRCVAAVPAALAGWLALPHIGVSFRSPIDEAASDRG